MKTWFSINWVALVAILISIVSLLFSVYNNSNNSTNKARVEKAIYLLKTDTLTNTERNDLIKQIETQTFKEDFYINQIGIQSDWIILYVSILFAFFGIIGFNIFNTQINNIREDNSKFQKENIYKHDKLLSEFNDLRNELETKHKNQKIESIQHFKQFEEKFDEFEGNINMLTGHTYEALSMAFHKTHDYLGSVHNKLFAINEYLLIKWDKPKILPRIDEYLHEIKEYFSKNKDKSVVVKLSVYEEVKETFKNVLKNSTSKDMENSIVDIMLLWENHVKVYTKQENT